MRHLAMFLFCAALTIAGLVGGWYAARQYGDSADGADAHAGEGGAAAEDPAQALDERTLANLGVTIEEVKRRTFTRARGVQGVIVDRPVNAQPVVAPVGGIVTAVHVSTGGYAKRGAPLITISRDPIARPKPDLTAGVLTPISEEVHIGVAALRSALGRLEIVDRNLERVRKAGAARAASAPDEPRLMRKSEIEYENERSRLLVERDGARLELRRHGLTDEQITAVERGGEAPPNQELWQHALKRHGLWPNAADAIQAAVPADQRSLPWCVAAIGELSAAGLATDALAQALGESQALASHFAEAAGLLLEGSPLATVRLLAEQNALHPEVAICAPNRLERWDVQGVDVRVGQRVEVGERLVRLHDAQTMWLRLEPVGAEIGYVVRALARGDRLRAVPLVSGAGPDLEDVRLLRLSTHAEESERGGRAFALVRNTPLCPPGGETACSWSLRVGMRYQVKVPVAALASRFVLPVAAVTNRGPDRVVFVREGAGFAVVTVRVDFEDHEVVVVADDGGIFDGDPVVMSGAFALSLAMQIEGAPKTEHGHDH